MLYLSFRQKPHLCHKWRLEKGFPLTEICGRNTLFLLRDMKKASTKKPRLRKSTKISKAVAFITHYYVLIMPLKLPNHTFSGSGYSTPKVSTVTLFITWSSTGLSFQSVSVSAILFTISRPSITLPKAA